MTAGITRRALLPATVGLAGATLLPAQAGAQSLADAPGTVLKPGIHRLTANTVIKGDLLVEPGAVLEVPKGCTLTLLGGLVAPIAPIFTGPGLVDLNRSRLAWAHPEWWGAAPGDGARDSLAALRACMRAHPAMQLLAADYYLSDTLVVDRPFSRIAGAGFRGTEGGRGTRLVVTSGTADVLHVGPAEKPPTVNDFAQNIEIRGLALCRSRPVEHRGDTAPAGLRAQFLLFAHFEQVSAFEHGNGFVARGLVRSTMRDCIAFRSLPGSRPGQPYRGFVLDGTGEIGLAGGNASLYLDMCNATIGGEPAISDGVGLLLQGAFADSFVTDFESTALETGIRIDGMTGAIGARARNGHVNLHLRMPIVDQCGGIGIHVRDTGPHTLIDLSDPYVAVAPSGRAAMQVETMRGALSMAGGQFVGNSNAAAGGKAAGLVARDSQGLQLHGLKILEHAQPAALERCTGFALQLLVANPTSRPRGPAVRLRDCTAGRLAAILSAGGDAFTAGIAVEGTAERIALDVTGIAPEAVGGSANRAWIAGRSVAAPFRDARITIEGA